MGRLRAVFVLTAMFSGLLFSAASLYAVANEQTKSDVRLAVHEAVQDALRLPTTFDSGELS